MLAPYHQLPFSALLVFFVLVQQVIPLSSFSIRRLPAPFPHSVSLLLPEPLR